MIEQSETRIAVSELALGRPESFFSVLADPRRHVEIDGSGTVQAAAGSEPITHVGQVFTMEMTYPSLGRYRTDNHVVDWEDGRCIAWTTGREGNPPAGVRWAWTFTPTTDGGTRIEHVYDWSQVTDPAVKARVSSRGCRPRNSLRP